MTGGRPLRGWLCKKKKEEAEQGRARRLTSLTEEGGRVVSKFRARSFLSREKGDAAKRGGESGSTNKNQEDYQ